MKQKIFFRADASGEIGYGHFTRTLALAEMLKENFDCTFFTQTPTEYQRKEVASICKLEELPAGDSNFDFFLNKLNGDEIVVLDNYFFSTSYQEKIKSKGCKLVCVDDMHDEHYVADLIINQCIEDGELIDCEDYSKCCLGLKWALLRLPFLNAIFEGNRKHKINGQRKRVAICFGGSDLWHFSEKALKWVLSAGNVQKIDVILGSRNSLLNLSDDRVTLHQSISAEKLSNIFLSCDFAIVSASSVCIEALSCGANVIAGYYVDNQKDFYNNLVKLDYIQGIGYMPLFDWNSKCKCVDNILTYRNISDVFGNIIISYRYNNVFKNLASGLYLRNVEKRDEQLLLEWRNDSDVRAQSFKNDIVSAEQHNSWFSNVILDKTRHLYILISERKKVGTIRLDEKDDEVAVAVVNYSISKEYRGLGLGKKIVKLAEEEVKLSSLRIRCMVAFVKQENLASRRVFIDNGYIESFDSEMNVYKYYKNLL